MRLRCAAAVIVTVVAVCAFGADGAPGFLWGDLAAGPYAVGFRVLYERDVSRPWRDGARRPIRIAVWYPAAPGVQSDTMRYVEYLHYDGPESFVDIDEPLEEHDRESWLRDLTEAAPDSGREIAAKLFATPTAAHRDAPPAPGRFPLVLYSAGLGARGDSNAELGEYLASHGYVVATVSKLGLPEAVLTLGSSPADLELNARDTEFAWTRLRQLALVDPAKIALVGHSAGGSVALYLAMRHPEVKAVVALDGSYGFAGDADAMRRLEGYAPSRVRASVLDLRRADHVQEATHDQAIIRSLRHSDRFLVSLPRMSHGDFTELGTIGLLMGVPLPPNKDGGTRRTGYDGNQHAYRAALDFLDAKLREDKDGLRRLSAEIASCDGARIDHLRP